MLIKRDGITWLSQDQDSTIFKVRLHFWASSYKKKTRGCDFWCVIHVISSSFGAANCSATYSKALNCLGEDIEERTIIFSSLHDSIGHWDAQTTKHLVTDRFWRPKVHVYISSYVKKFNWFERLYGPLRFHTNVCLPQTNLFEAF